MSSPRDRLLELVRAAGEEAAMRTEDEPSSEMLLGYLRGELPVEERLEIQRALVRSEALRQRLLELVALEEEEALERFDAEPAPAIPDRARRSGGRRPRRRIWVPAAAAALLLVAALPLFRWSEPVSVGDRDWSELTRLRTEQFEPSVLRGQEADLPEILPSVRLALAAALLETLTWEEDGGWSSPTSLPPAVATRNGTAIELEDGLPTPAAGVAFFDLGTRTLWSHELAPSSDLPRRFAFPGPAAGGWVLLRWWPEDGGFDAAVVAGAL